MMQAIDPKNLYTAIHTRASGELLRLMDGFYSNIEDGLFELAFRNESKVQQRHTVELMRELRFRRKHLLRTFGKRLQADTACWLGGSPKGPEMIEERMLANDMAKKCRAHFNPVLQSIADRTSFAISERITRDELPLNPEAVSYHFVMSCRSVRFDKHSIVIVQDLFSRFVLDRLGAIYGTINQELIEAGYPDVVPEDLALPTSA